MRAFIVATLASVLLAPLPQLPPRDQPARQGLQSAATAAISGRVYAAATGTPLQGALVVLASASSSEIAPGSLPRDAGARTGAVTDALGMFRITGVAPGVYRLIANPAAYAGRYLAAGHGALRGNDAGKRLTLLAGEEINNADIALPTGFAIEGRVVDAAGEPLGRISVFAARLMAGSESPQRTSHPLVMTDDLGRYRIYGLEPGTYYVAATGQVFFPTTAFIESRLYTASPMQRENEPFVNTFHPSALAETSAQPVRLGSQDLSGIDITLQRTRRFAVSGMVLDSQGQPAASTIAALIRPGVATPDSLPLRTDPQGRFTLGALEPGDYRILIGSGMASGLTSVNGRTEFADAPFSVTGDVADLVVVTRPGIGLAGRIVFAEGPPSPAPDMRIVFRRPDPTRSKEVVATFGDEQRFFGSDVFGPLLVRVPSLPKGWILKSVMLGGTDITDVPTVFRPEHDGQLLVVLSSRPSAVEGEVRGESGPATGEATVYVFSEDRHSWSLSSPRTAVTEMGEKGRFSVAGLTGGRYYAIAIARDGFRAPSNPGAAFFDLLSKEATPFVLGDDERRTVDLRLWRWPE